MSRAASWLKEHELAAFYAIALFLISGAMAAAAATENEAFALLGVVGPALSALLVTRLAKGKDAVRALLVQLVTWRVRWKWYLAALLLIPAVALAAIVLTSGQFPMVDTASILPKIPILLVLMTGEEIGWLPLLPEVTGEPRTFLAFVGLVCLVSALVVTVNGPENLSRERRPQA